MLQVVAQALGHRKRPLPHRQARNDVQGKMRSGLDHAPGGAGRTDATAFAGIRDQEVTTAVGAAGPGKSVGEEAAFEVAAEFPRGNTGNATTGAVVVPCQPGGQMALHGSLAQAALRSPPATDSASGGAALRVCFLGTLSGRYRISDDARTLTLDVPGLAVDERAEAWFAAYEWRPVDPNDAQHRQTARDGVALRVAVGNQPLRGDAPVDGLLVIESTHRAARHHSSCPSCSARISSPKRRNPFDPLEKDHAQLLGLPEVAFPGLPADRFRAARRWRTGGAACRRACA